ncbi:MAG: hypothetical protein LBQ32_12975 [Burkholderiaceae bacterium]|jgi:hypothetical protein|nr:hypothetical protein [Burkholderiaceae bacterium]
MQLQQQDGLRAAGASASALAETARTLQFLALIETTIDIVSSDVAHVHACTQGIRNLAARYRQIFVEIAVPEEARLVALLDKTMEAARRIYQDANKRHALACNDKELHPGDGVVDVFVELIKASQELFDYTSEFKEWVQTHNALLEPSICKIFDNAEDFIAELNS